MGNCMGKCLPKTDSFFSYEDRADCNELLNNGIEDDNNKIRNFLIRNFLKIGKRKKPKAGILELVNDNFIPSKEKQYSKLHNSCSVRKQSIPLQCLDARALLMNTANSTPASSLDLEWEHEALHLQVMQEPCSSSWVNVSCERNNSQSTVFDDNTDYSRVPSADSLEWDSVQNSLQETDIDPDTQALLNEIERLTEQALKETGHTLNS